MEWYLQGMVYLTGRPDLWIRICHCSKHHLTENASSSQYKRMLSEVYLAQFGGFTLKTSLNSSQQHVCHITSLTSLQSSCQFSVLCCLATAQEYNKCFYSCTVHLVKKVNNEIYGKKQTCVH